MKFQKKPVVIEAYLYQGDGLGAMEWSAQVRSDKEHPTNLVLQLGHGLYVETLEGRMHVPEGNWIICGVLEELYSCDPVVFERTYEPIGYGII